MVYNKNKGLSSAEKGQMDKSVDFPAGPEDTVSAVRWSPVSNHLAASAWDGKVYIYDATDGANTSTIKAVTAMNIGSPVLDCDFSKDGTIAVGGATDNKIHIMDLNSGQTMALEGHAKPVRSVRFVDIPAANAPIIASGSWDKTVRFWDMRQPEAVGTLQLPERVFAMDAAGPVLTAATADNQLQMVKLSDNPLAIWKTVESPLNHQISALSLSADGSRWAIGSIEGRVSGQAVDEKKDRLEKISFKCHREPSATKKTQTDVYAVNAVAVSPAHKDVLATGGSDGTFCIWDLRERQRMRTFPKAAGPVTALAFARDGTAMAYAVGYDWAKGYQHHKPGAVTKLVLHKFADVLKE